MADTIELVSPRDGFVFTALTAPAEGERRGGIIIIQEIFGLDRYVEEDVARWAAKGFEALAPAMFDRQEKGFLAAHDPEGIQRGFAHAMANGLDNPISDVRACVEALKDKGPVFIVGYCYGGTVAWRAASEVEGLSAAASYYGGQVGAMAGLPLACPAICHFGRKDAHIPADEVKAALLAAHPEVPVHIYEASGHGFNNDGRPDSDPADAALARERTLAFFLAHGGA